MQKKSVFCTDVRENVGGAPVQRLEVLVGAQREPALLCLPAQGFNQVQVRAVGRQKQTASTRGVRRKPFGLH